MRRITPQLVINVMQVNRQSLRMSEQSEPYGIGTTGHGKIYDP
jgi:hypothetical protein